VAYLVMEYLEGQTLAERLKSGRPSPVDQTISSSIFEIMYERMKDRRLMPIDEAIAILSQTCDAMDEAHRLGILHRDLKPENIWLEPAGPNGSNVKILDFGVARLQDILALDEFETPTVPGEPAIRHQPFSITEAETLRLNYTSQQISRFGSVMGTPKYMSPEQCRGERLDKSSDVYSLGVIAYQMLTGEPPFTGTTPELLIRHRETDPAQLREKRRDIPAGVDDVVRQALAKDKNARPETAGAFAFQLQLHAAGNEWIRRQADALNRKYRWKLLGIALRMQSAGWLFSLMLLFATMELPGMSSVRSVAVFGLLWLVVAAIMILGQNTTTAACSLFLEQMEGGATQAANLRSIVATVRRRSRDLALSACGLIIPPLIHDELSVEEARRRSAQMRAPIRQQARYTLFRRVLVFAASLTVLQQILTASAFVLDRGPIDFNSRDVFLHDMSNSIFFWLPLALIIGIVAFNLSLKSSIEQYALYLASRKSLGAVPLGPSALLPQPDSENRRLNWRSHLKTYGPSCAIIALIIGFHLSKFPWMTDRMERADLYSVKALHASGVPVPLRLNKPGYEIPVFARSPEMARYLIGKGMDVNAPIDLGRFWLPFGGAADGLISPLMAALDYHSSDVARALIENGADANARDSLGRTAMAVAVVNCPEAIELLLASGADINEQTRFGSPLLIAARHQRSYPEAVGLFALRQQARQIKGQPNAVKILIEKGADPNARDEAGRNALMLMSMEPQLNDDLEMAIEARRKIDPSLRTRRNDKLVEMISIALLDAGCDIDAADNKGRTPLMYAVAFERSEVVNLLLKRGANADAKDHYGDNALSWAMKSGSDQVFRLLSMLSSVEGKGITGQRTRIIEELSVLSEGKKSSP